MMAANPATVTGKCNLYTATHLSSQPRILVRNSIPFDVTSPGCHCRISPIRFYGLEPLGLGLRSLQVSSSGGAGDGYGGSDGGGSSGGGGGSHDSNWSFISW